MTFSRPSGRGATFSMTAVLLLALLVVFQAGCSKDATGVMKAYLGQESCLDRTQFILDPEANRPLLVEQYKDTKDCQRTYEAIKPDGCDKLADGDYCSVEVVFTKNDTSYYCVTKTAEGLKIDWRCSIGYNPVSLPAFMAQRTTTPRLFRISTELSSIYMAEYGHAEKTHLALSLRNQEGKMIWGYLRRDSPTAPGLLEALKDGKRHAVILELQYLPDSRDASVVEVQRFVSNFWRQIPEEVVPSAAPLPPQGTSASTAMPQETSLKPTPICVGLSKLELRGDPTECAKLISCCCTGEPPNLLGKSKMADAMCLGAPKELTKENGTYDCKRYRQSIVELYKADGKPTPDGCSDVPIQSTGSPQAPSAVPPRGTSQGTPKGGPAAPKATQEPAALPPAALPPSPTPTPTAPASKGACGCRPGDMMCAMKCAKK